MKDGTTLPIILAVIALPVATIGPGFVATHKKMNAFRFPPGTSVADVLKAVGKPNKIIHRDETLNAARRTYTPPPVAEGTALYFYPKEGFPYFNAYILVDEQREVVLRSDVENLWW